MKAIAMREKRRIWIVLLAALLCLVSLLALPGARMAHAEEEQENNQATTIYWFEDTEGIKHYRIYGSPTANSPAGYYVCNENGVYVYPFELVTPEQDGAVYNQGTIADNLLIMDVKRLSDNQPLPDTMPSYNLITDTALDFTVAYSPPAEMTNNTVLFVETLAYGSKFTACPTGNDFMAGAALSSDGRGIAIRLEDGIQSHQAVEITFSTASTPLTSAQAIAWMDNGSLPASGLSVKVLSGDLYNGDLSKYTGSEPLAGASTQYFSMSPTSYTGYAMPGSAVKATYSAWASSYGPLTEASLARTVTGRTAMTGDTDYLKYSVPVLGYETPLVHRDEMPLIEYTGFKVYSPDQEDNNLVLDNVKYGSMSNWNEYESAVQKLDWTITKDVDNQGRVYFLVERPASSSARVLNVSASGTTRDPAFFLTFKRVDTDQELRYSTSGYLYELAPETELYYRYPTGETTPENNRTSAQTLTHAGPTLRTRNRIQDDILKVIGHLDRKQVNAEKEAQRHYVGNQYKRVFTYITNNHYAGELKKSSDSALADRNLPDGNYEVIPTYDGGIIETYDFPFEMRPESMEIVSQPDGNTSDPYGSYKEIVLESIRYWTYGNDTPQVAGSQDIASINSALQDKNGSRTATYTFANATAEQSVTKVEVKWTSLISRMVQNSLSPVTPTSQYGTYVNRISFTFTVGDVDKDNNPITSGDAGQVFHNVAYVGNAEKNPSISQTDYLWFYYAKEGCTALMGEARYKASDFWAYAGSGEVDGGTIYLLQSQVDGAAARKTLTNPVIDINVMTENIPYTQIAGSTYQDAGPQMYQGVDGITDEMGLSFLSGRFSAMPFLSGWQIDYTTNLNSGVRVHQLPDTIVRSEAVDLKLALDAGEYLTSLKLRYIGEYSYESRLSGSGGRFDLLKNIMVRPLATNPGASSNALSPTDAIPSHYFVAINAKGTWSNCICGAEESTHEMGVGTYTKSQHNKSYIYHNWPGLGVYFSRQGIFAGTAVNATGKSIVWQGGTVEMPSPAGYHLKFTDAAAVAQDYQPWRPEPGSGNIDGEWENVRTGIYIELLEPDMFLVSLENSTVNGQEGEIDKYDVDVVTRTVGGVDKVFLRFILREGEKRYGSSFYDYYGKDMVHLGGDSSSFFANNLGEYVNIGLYCLPGTAKDTYQPFGDIYFDYSDLLVKYGDSSARTTYDFSAADYESRLVEDIYDLSFTNIGDKKLFKGDLRGYTVEVHVAAAPGVTLQPGKSGAYQSASSELRFFIDERDQLEGLLSMTSSEVKQGEETGTVRDFTTYLKLPRKADGAEFDMALREPPTVIGNSTNTNIVTTFAYTTASDIYDDTQYFTEAPTTEAGWNAVTGIRVKLDELASLASTNMRLKFRALGDLDTLEDARAQVSGMYTFRAQSDDGSLVPLVAINPITFVRSAYLVTPLNGYGVVFEDFYDENGYYTSGTNKERYASGMDVVLYAPNGDEITRTKTNDSGRFTLRSNTKAAGQRIVLLSQDKYDSYVMTRKSVDPVSASERDSDFTRIPLGGELVLPALPAVGISRISAGVLRMPELEVVEEVRLLVGESLDTPLKAKTEDNVNYGQAGYTIEILETEDPDIATINTGVYQLSGEGTSTQTTGSITGVSEGQTSVKVILTNGLGDTFEKTIIIIVSESASANVELTFKTDDPDLGLVQDDDTEAKDETYVVEVNPETGTIEGYTAVPEKGNEFLYWEKPDNTRHTDPTIETEDLVRDGNDLLVEGEYIAVFGEMEIELTFNTESATKGLVKVSEGAGEPSEEIVETLNPQLETPKTYEAVPEPGYEFVKWVGPDGDIESGKVLAPDKLKKVTVNGYEGYEEAEYTAYFKLLDNVELTFKTDDPDLGLVQDDDTEAKDEAYVVEVNPETGTIEGYTAVPEKGNEFLYWEKPDDTKHTDPTIGTEDLVRDGDDLLVEGEYIAVFGEMEIELTFNTESATKGLVKVSEGAGEPSEEIVETLNPQLETPKTYEAVPEPGYGFVKWVGPDGDIESGKVLAPDKLKKVTVNGYEGYEEAEYTAYFELLDNVELKFVTNDEDLGLVENDKTNEKEPAHVININPVTGDVDGYTAVPEDGSRFVYWEKPDGSKHTDPTITKDDLLKDNEGRLEGGTYTAVFAEQGKVVLTYAVKGGEGGYVLRIGDEERVRSTNEQVYADPDLNEPARTTAEVEPGYEFLGWEWGDEIISQEPKLPLEKLALDNNGQYQETTYYAVFKALKVDLTFNTESETKGLVKVSEGADEPSAEIVERLNPQLDTPKTYEAVPKPGYEFVKWVGPDGDIESGKVLTPDKLAKETVNGHEGYKEAEYTAYFKLLDDVELTFTTNDPDLGQVENDETGEKEPKHVINVNPETGEVDGYTAVPEDDSQFVHWEKPDGTVHEDPTLTPDDLVRDKDGKLVEGEYVAVFEPKAPKKPDEVELTFTTNDPDLGQVENDKTGEEKPKHVISVDPETGEVDGYTAVPKDDDSQFVHWEKPDGTVHEDPTLTPDDLVRDKDGNLVEGEYVAVFEPKTPTKPDDVDLTFKTNDPDLGVVEDDKTGEKKPEHTVTVDPESEGPGGYTAEEKPGSDFKYWEKPDGSRHEDPTLTPDDLVRDKDGNLVEGDYIAVFEERLVKHTFLVGRSGGGSVSPASQTLKAITGIAEGSIPTASAGYRFVKWTETPDGSGATAPIGAGNRVLPVKKNGLHVDRTYYAHFEALPTPTATPSATPTAIASATPTAAPTATPTAAPTSTSTGSGGGGGGGGSSKATASPTQQPTGARSSSPYLSAPAASGGRRMQINGNMTDVGDHDVPLAGIGSRNMGDCAY